MLEQGSRRGEAQCDLGRCGFEWQVTRCHWRAAPQTGRNVEINLAGDNDFSQKEVGGPGTPGLDGFHHLSA